MKKINKGWIRGLSDGFEVSGAILGAVVPLVLILGVFSIIFSSYFWCKSTVTDPGPCQNYSYDKGLFAADTAVCNKWPNMTMKIEGRFIKSDVVHCTCPVEESLK